MTTLTVDALERLSGFLAEVAHAALTYDISVSSGFIEVQGANVSGTLHAYDGKAEIWVGE